MSHTLLVLFCLKINKTLSVLKSYTKQTNTEEVDTQKVSTLFPQSTRFD